eukprot:5936759-Pyramimonas_sp.AAC.1
MNSSRYWANDSIKLRQSRKAMSPGISSAMTCCMSFRQKSDPREPNGPLGTASWSRSNLRWQKS